MSERYEFIDAAHAPVRLAAPGEDFGYGDVLDTPALVLGEPQATALVVTGTAPELTALGTRVQSVVGDRAPRTEVVVVRHPDADTDVRVWVDGVEVTAAAGTQVVVVDPGAGWEREEWAVASAGAQEVLTGEAAQAAQDAFDAYDDSEFIVD